MQLMLIKRLFKVNVTIIGKISHRLNMAKKLGADFVILIRGEEEEEEKGQYGTSINSYGYDQKIKNIKREFSPNVIFVSNNNPFSLNLALKLVNKNGKIVLFSGIKNQNQINKKERKKMINIDPNFIHYNQISMFGCFSSTPKDMNEAMNIINLKEINLKSLISHSFSLIDIKEALTTAESYLGLKSIINNF